VIAVRGDVLLARVAEPVGRGPPGAAPHDRRIRDGEVVDRQYRWNEGTLDDRSRVCVRVVIAAMRRSWNVTGVNRSVLGSTGRRVARSAPAGGSSAAPAASRVGSLHRSRR
jgi:hypothetical protein